MTARRGDAERPDVYLLDHGVEVLLGGVLDRGRQGAIREVIGEGALAAKIFVKDDATANWVFRHLRVSRHLKIDARAWLDGQGYPRLAWPIAQLSERDDAPAGYLMVRFGSGWRQLDDLLSNSDRATFEISLTWQHLVRIATNLAELLDRVHEAGFIVGDLSAANVLVSARDQRVAFVDCDDMIAVDDPQEHGSRPLTTERYGACELHEPDLGKFSHLSDAWALGVLIIQLLQDGAHPFEGSGRIHGAPRGILQNLGDGRTRFKQGGWFARATSDRSWLPVDTLTPELLGLARRCVVDGRIAPGERPTAAEWARELRRVRFTRCPDRESHVFSSHLLACPWCAHVDHGQPDPFGHTKRSVR